MLPEPVRAAIFWTSNAVWGPWTVVLLLGTGLFLTIRLRFVQIVRFPDAVRTMVPAAQAGAPGALSPFQAFMTALVAGVACLTTTPFTQPNSIAVVWQSQFHVPTWASGVVIAVLTCLVVIGGIKSIGRAAERLAPLKVFLYLAGGLIVILTHAGE